MVENPLDLAEDCFDRVELWAVAHVEHEFDVELLVPGLHVF